MGFDTVIFDLDGTLLNTLDDLADSVNEALEALSCPQRSLEEIRGYIGVGVHYLMKNALPQGADDEKIEEAVLQFQKFYRKNMSNKTKPYDGICSLLEELWERGIKMAVVSNKSDGNVKKLVGALFGEYIKIAVGERAHRKRKPAPDSVNEVIKLLDTVPDRVLYIGDTEVDMETAKNAGVHAVGVTWGFRNRKNLQEAGAQSIIDSPKEIMLFFQ